MTQAKAAKDGAQVVRVLKALRAATLFIREQRTPSVDLLAKTLNLERAVAERFYPLYRDQYNPELTVPDSVLEEYRGVATLGSRTKRKLRILSKFNFFAIGASAEKAKQ